MLDYYADIISLLIIQIRIDLVSNLLNTRMPTLSNNIMEGFISPEN